MLFKDDLSDPSPDTECLSNPKRVLRPRNKKKETFKIKKGQSRLQLGAISYCCPWCREKQSNIRMLTTHMHIYHRKPRAKIKKAAGDMHCGRNKDECKGYADTAIKG